MDVDKNSSESEVSSFDESSSDSSDDESAKLLIANMVYKYHQFF